MLDQVSIYGAKADGTEVIELLGNILVYKLRYSAVNILRILHKFAIVGR